MRPLGVQGAGREVEPVALHPDVGLQRRQGVELAPQSRRVGVQTWDRGLEQDPGVDGVDRRAADQQQGLRRMACETLQRAGISDADIVRLTELVAFMGYQVRLTAGLALLKELSA